MSTQSYEYEYLALSIFSNSTLLFSTEQHWWEKVWLAETGWFMEKVGLSEMNKMLHEDVNGHLTCLLAAVFLMAATWCL